MPTTTMDTPSLQSLLLNAKASPRLGGVGTGRPYSLSNELTDSLRNIQRELRPSETLLDILDAIVLSDNVFESDASATKASSEQ